MFSEKGQAFEPFKLLIGAIFALLVLVIILGSINYFQGLSTTVSRDRLIIGLKNAVNLHNGETLLVAKLQFNSGDSFSSKGLSNIMGIQSECIEFRDNGFSNYEVSPDRDLLTVKQATVL